MHLTGREKVAGGVNLGVKVVLLLLLALIIPSLGYIGVGLFVAAWLSTPSHQQEKEQRVPSDVGLDYRKVNFKAADGLELAAWWVPSKGPPSGAVVLVPGLGGDKSEWHILQTAAVYAQEEHAILMIDLRAQGSSEGERITMGYREVRDVRGALAWLREQGFGSKKVALHGFSMGGATVLRSAPDTGVAAVVVEAAYADLPLILRQRLSEVSGLPSFLTPGVMLASKLFLGIDPWAVRPEEDARKLSEEGVPLLIIHSTDDEVVPFGHARRLKAAYPEAVLWRLEGYGHVEAYSHPEYRQKILGFLKRTKPEGIDR